MRFKLARAAAAALSDAGIGFAVIGAAAMAPHGYQRATQDLDFLVFDRRAFHREVWQALVDAGVPVSIRVSDHDDDPIVGVVRIGRAGRRRCDVVMPRGSWHQDVIGRSREAGPTLEIDGLNLPVVTLVDLLVLKLSAGGPLDLRDVHELLNANRGHEPELRAEVDAQVGGLDADTRRAWTTVLAERG